MCGAQAHLGGGLFRTRLVDGRHTGPDFRRENEMPPKGIGALVTESNAFMRAITTPSTVGHFAAQDPLSARRLSGWRAWVNQFRPKLAGTALAFGALGLSACSEPPQPALTVGMNTWIGYDPLVLARDQQLIDTQQVKVVELSSSSETLRHLRNGLLDAAALTLDESLRLADEGFDLRVVAVLDASTGADVVMADPAIGSLSQLKGARIAVEGTTVGALMLERLLQSAGLQRSDVDVLNMESPVHLTALRSGRVNVAVSYEPVAGLLRAEGYQAIFDSRQMPGDILDVLVVRARALQERPAQVDALLAGWERGRQALQGNPEAAARVLAPGVELTPEDYLATLQNLTFYSSEQSLAQLSGELPELGQNALRLVNTLQTMGLIKAPPDWERLVDAGSAQRLQARTGGT